MNVIFAFKENGLSEHGEVRGEFIRYKHIPKVYDRMKRKGIILKDIFTVYNYKLLMSNKMFILLQTLLQQSNKCKFKAITNIKT